MIITKRIGNGGKNLRDWIKERINNQIYTPQSCVSVLRVYIYVVSWIRFANQSEALVSQRLEFKK